MDTTVDMWAELCGQWEAVYGKRCLGKAVGRGVSSLALSEPPCVHQPGRSYLHFLLLDEIKTLLESMSTPLTKRHLQSISKF